MVYKLFKWKNDEFEQMNDYLSKHFIYKTRWCKSVVGLYLYLYFPAVLVIGRGMRCWHFLVRKRMNCGDAAVMAYVYKQNVDK